MNETNVDDRLLAEVTRLEGCLDRERRAARRRGRTLALLSVGLVAVVAFFLHDGWRTVQGQWTEDRLARSFSREMQSFSPMAVEELVTLSETLMPVFAEEGRRALERRSDDIEAVMNAQVDAFLQELHEDTYSRLLETKNGLREGAERLLLEQYPDMDAERQAMLVHIFVASVDQAVEASVEDFVRRYSREVEDFAAALQHFEATGEDLSTHDLQRKLVHLWLQAIDERIMNP